MTDSRAMRALTIETEIHRFIAEEQYSLAMILSQSMLELLVEREVRSLADGLQVGSFGDAALELLGSFSLNRRTQRFFEHALEVRFKARCRPRWMRISTTIGCGTGSSTRALGPSATMPSHRSRSSARSPGACTRSSSREPAGSRSWKKDERIGREEEGLETAGNERKESAGGGKVPPREI
jgi:hypothetical protein